MNKNEILALKCENLGANMEGICRHDGMAVFVKGMLPGERGQVVITRVQKSFAFGRLLSLAEKSPFRKNPECPVYGRCGGCSCRHMRYETGLAAKRQQVTDCFLRIAGLTVQPDTVLGMENPNHYRNKTTLPVGGSVGDVKLGFYAPRSHEIIGMESCPVAMEQSNTAAQAVTAWMNAYAVPPYAEDTHTGLVRHLMTRVNRAGDVMAVLCVNGDSVPHADALLAGLSDALPGLRSVYLLENLKRTNVVLDGTYHLLYGEKTLTETLLGLRFTLSPSAFFQVNGRQTELLYETAMGFAALTGEEMVADIYCGVGTLSLLAAQRGKAVLGIEVVEAAVENARQNALDNGIKNTSFMAGPAEELLPAQVAAGFRPDVVIIDPPRKGADAKVLDAILSAQPKRLVYISCDVATQARDAKHLTDGGYRVTRITPVDMFAWTSDVESVALFERE